MNTATRTLGLMALCCAASVASRPQPQTAPSTAPAAQPQPAAPPAKPKQASAQAEAGEPRAGTANEAATATAPAASSAAPAASTGPAPATGRAPAPAARASAGGTAAPGGASGQKPGSKIDRLELGTATVTGDREQPKVMYIVPWKRSDIGDLAGKPMNSLVDEILAPVDRDVFKREVVYYNAVQADASQNGASPKPGQQGEK